MNSRTLLQVSLHLCLSHSCPIIQPLIKEKGKKEWPSVEVEYRNEVPVTTLVARQTATIKIRIRIIRVQGDYFDMASLCSRGTDLSCDLIDFLVRVNEIL